MSVYSYPFKQTESFENFDYKLISYLRSKFENDWESIEHLHPHCEILYVISGKGFIMLNKERYELSKDKLVVINENTLHTEISFLNDPLEYVVFSVKGIAFYPDDDLKKININQQNNLYIFDFSSISSIFKNYINLFELELKTPNKYTYTICKNLMDNIILFITHYTDIVHFSQKIFNNKTRSLLNSNKKSNQLIVLISDYFHKYYQRPISLEELCEKFFISKYYLIHLFKKSLGVSPIQYLTSIRIDHAKKLLITSDFSISTIALMTGFPNASNFYRVFKSVCKQSPSIYRKEAAISSIQES